MDYRTNALETDSTSTGAVAWAGLALARAYHYMKNPTYLEGAIVTGTWIIQKTRKDSLVEKIHGFVGGEHNSEFSFSMEPKKWRSVKHNSLVYALFHMLYTLTNDLKWDQNMGHARDFVNYCLNPGKNLFNRGVDENNELEEIFTADAQIIPLLARIPKETNSILQSLQYFFVTKQLVTESPKKREEEGISYASQTGGIINENTAAAIFAFYDSGRREHQEIADRFLDSLERQIGSAENGDKHGLVATPGNEVDTGLGRTYKGWLQCAPTAWAGLAFMLTTKTKGKSSANPNPFLLPSK